MKRVSSYLLYGGIMIFAAALAYTSSDSFKNKTADAIGEQKNSAKTAGVQQTKPAEKIEVFLFHNTQRCYSCVTIGKYAKATVEQNFPLEVQSGKIEFKEINIDLPENKALASKFKAAGSALFINSIVNGDDNIQQDTQVWRLVSDEQAFISYLTDKIEKQL